MYMTGWSPDKSQPRAAKRGSAQITFQEFAAQLEKQGDAGGGPLGLGAPGGPPAGKGEQ